jgi:hypothetical protein
MMKMEDPRENRLPSGTSAPNRSNNVAVHAGKAMSMAMAMTPPTIVPMSLGIRLFMECLPNYIIIIHFVHGIAHGWRLEVGVFSKGYEGRPAG